MTNVLKKCSRFKTTTFDCSFCGCQFETDQYFMQETKQWSPDYKREHIIFYKRTDMYARCPACGEGVNKEVQPS